MFISLWYNINGGWQPPEKPFFTYERIMTYETSELKKEHLNSTRDSLHSMRNFDNLYLFADSLRQRILMLSLTMGAEGIRTTWSSGVLIGTKCCSSMTRTGKLTASSIRNARRRKRSCFVCPTCWMYALTGKETLPKAIKYWWLLQRARTIIVIKVYEGDRSGIGRWSY